MMGRQKLATSSTYGRRRIDMVLRKSLSQHSVGLKKSMSVGWSVGLGTE